MATEQSNASEHLWRYASALACSCSAELILTYQAAEDGRQKLLHVHLELLQKLSS